MVADVNGRRHRVPRIQNTVTQPVFAESPGPSRSVFRDATRIFFATEIAQRGVSRERVSRRPRRNRVVRYVLERARACRKRYEIGSGRAALSLSLSHSVRVRLRTLCIRA